MLWVFVRLSSLNQMHKNLRFQRSHHCNQRWRIWKHLNITLQSPHSVARKMQSLYGTMIYLTMSTSFTALFNWLVLGTIQQGTHLHQHHTRVGLQPPSHSAVYLDQLDHSDMWQSLGTGTFHNACTSPSISHHSAWLSCVSSTANLHIWRADLDLKCHRNLQCIAEAPKHPLHSQQSLLMGTQCCFQPLHCAQS